MGSRFPFTKAALADLIDANPGARIVAHDERQPGLIAELRESGSLTFYSYGRVKGGAPCRCCIGAFPVVTIDNARTQAKANVAAMAAGINPNNAKRERRQEATLGELAAHWLDYAKQHKKTWQADKTLFDRLLVGWKTRRLSAIRRSDIQALHARVGRDNGPYMANRLLALLGAMFNKAADVGFTGPNPAKGIKKFREQSRDRFLQPSELPAFMEAVKAEPNDTLRDFFLLCLYTGARKSNVQAMAWADVNLAAATWRIPDTKSGEPVTIHLSKPALEILAKRVVKADGCQWVFPGGKKNKAGHLVSPKFAWQRLCGRAGFTDLRMHDLRRSLGSWQAAAGASLSVIGKSLGHRDGSQATAIYARLNLDPVRASVDTAVAAMLAAAQPKEGVKDA